jgi:hypothetical protein
MTAAVQATLAFRLRSAYFGPAATGSAEFELHSDQEPGYSAASTPTEASAASTTDAVTPDPQ